MANLADLTIGVDADVSGVETAMTSAEQSVEGFEETTGRVSGFIDAHWQKIAAGAAAGSAAMEGFARTQAPLVESAAKLGASIGEDADAMRQLAIDTANVTRPLDEVYAEMEIGRQQGLKSADQLAEFSAFWDTVGDATGEAGPALAKAGVALRAVGIDAGNEAEALAALGFITEETTSSTGDFLNFLDRTGPELRDLGANVDDAAAIMGVLESELGMSGRTARTEFRSAISESDGTMAGLLDTLGVSAAQFDEYRGKVEASSGVIERNADIHAESYTAMQKAQHWASELMHKYSGLTQVAGNVAAGLASVVPVISSVVAAKRLGAIASAQSAAVETAAANTSKTSVISAIGAKIAAMARWVATTVAAGAKAAAQMAVTAAKFVAHYVKMAAVSLAQAARMAASWVIAMGPVGWVIAAVVALVALIIANWDTVKRWTKAAWEWVSDKIAAVWRWITDTTRNAVDSVVRFFTNLRDRVVSTVSNLWDRVVQFFRNLKADAIRIVGELVTGYVNLVLGLRDRIMSIFTGIKDAVVDRVEALMDRIRGIKDAVLGFFSGAGRWLLDAGKNIIRGLIDGVKNMIPDVGGAISNVVSEVTDRLPWSPAKKGPLRAKPPEEGGANIVALMARGMAGEVGTLASMADRAAAAALPRVGVPRIPSMAGTSPTGGTSAGGPSTVVLQVGDREFVGYMREQADVVVADRDRQMLAEVAAGAGA